MFFNYGNYYYIIVALQALCAFHSYRRGTLNQWIWYIVFLPIVGSLIYIFSEMRGARGLRAPKIDMSAVINPGGKIKKLEDNLKFTDTFANKILLADAYLAAGQTDKAIGLYEGSLTGAFVDNEHVLAQLMVAYFGQERYDDVIALARKIYKSAKFGSSKSHLLYAKALEFSGKPDLAEAEFKLMKGRYSNFEQRFEYGQFLIRADRHEEAHQLFTQMLEELPHLSAMERNASRQWFAKTKDELKNLEV